MRSCSFVNMRRNISSAHSSYQHIHTLYIYKYIRCTYIYIHIHYIILHQLRPLFLLALPCYNSLLETLHTCILITYSHVRVRASACARTPRHSIVKGARAHEHIGTHARAHARSHAREHIQTRTQAPARTYAYTHTRRPCLSSCASDQQGVKTSTDVAHCQRQAKDALCDTMIDV